MTTVARAPSPLRLLRLAQGLTQDQVAGRAHLSRETLSRLERGEAPTLRTAQALSSVLDAPVGALFPADWEGTR